MNKQNKSITRVSKILIFAVFMFGISALNTFGQGNPYINPCVVGTYINQQQVDANAEKCIPAKQSLNSAAPIVIGKSPDDTEMKYWLYLVTHSAKYGSKFNEGLKLSDAVNFLKDQFSASSLTEERAKIINRAYQEVYGRDSKATEQASWETQIKAQTAWYATIVTSEIQKLNQDQTERNAMLNRAYQKSMGRDANETDLKYWLPRTEHYRQIVDATRSWLYSEKGTKDLVETISRALLKKKGGNRATDESIKSAMTKFTPDKKIYAEMIQGL